MRVQNLPKKLDENGEHNLGNLSSIIEEGDSARLIRLLDGGEAEHLLTEKYGGNGDGGVDDRGLFQGTSPLLHAALCGRKSTLLTVIGALQETNSVELHVMTRDGGGRTVLQLAALSGSDEAFTISLHACESCLRAQEMSGMLTSRNTANGRTMLMAAAGSGNPRTFEAALEATRDDLEQDKIKLKEKLKETDNGGQTLLHLAAQRGNERGVEVVLGAFREALNRTEMSEVLTARDSVSTSTVLMAAAASGSGEALKVVLDAMRHVLVPPELKKHLLEEDDRDRTLLQLAALNSNQNGFNAVWDACRELGIKAAEMRERRGFPCGGTAALMASVESGDKDMFQRAVGEARTSDDAHECREQFISKNILGETMLSKAVESGNLELFGAVRSCASDLLGREEQENLVRSKNIFGESLLAKAFDKGNTMLFEAVLDCAWEVLDFHQLHEFIESDDVDGVASTVATQRDALTLSSLLLSRAIDTAVDSGHVGLFEAAVNCVVRRCRSVDVDEKKIADLIGGYVESVQESSRNSYVVLRQLSETAVRCALSGHKVADERNSEKDKIFVQCARMQLDNKSSATADFDFNILSSLLANSARPSALILKELSCQDPGSSFKTCCLRAVTSAANPFIPGITLSIKLAEAAKQANDEERIRITDVQSSVDELTLEMFKRLPQTVHGCAAGMDGCTSIFEPGVVQSSDDSDGLGDPLDMILSNEQQLKTFCQVPLVMDFLSKKFKLGLPDLIDTEGTLRNDAQLNCLRRMKTNGEPSGLVLDGVGATFQAADSKLVSMTFFPGAQFIVAGVVAASSQYYRVPALRMVLDFVVYIGMVAALSYFVLFQSSTENLLGDDLIVDHRFSFFKGEGACALLFITAAMYREGREIKRDIRSYFKDQWNVLDDLGILCLFIGMVIRCADWTNPWGPAFYALSAPLVVSRILFFAQILPFWGPMIQVIFRMTATLLQFGAVMLVIIIGFTMALHVLFSDVDTFGETLLGLFKAMLGDTEFFNEISGGRYDRVATILVVWYLCVVTIMLLNLLVAILSTAHAQVQENVDGEFKVSKARFVKHYRMVVENDLLPAPLNLVQLVLSLPVYVGALAYYSLVEAAKDYDHPDTTDPLTFWANVCDGAKGRQKSFRGVVGRVAFWAVLGPVAVAGGAILWGLSGFSYAQYALYSNRRRSTADNFARVKLKFASSSRWRLLQGLSILLVYFCGLTLAVLGSVLVFVWCVVGAPFGLFFMWLVAPFRFMLSFLVEKEHIDEGEPMRGIKPKVDSMLRKGPGGAGVNNLREFLGEGPKKYVDFRQDDKGGRAMVEHITLLRDSLVKATKGEIEELRKEIQKTIKDELEELRSKVESMVLGRGEKLGSKKNDLAE